MTLSQRIPFTSLTCYLLILSFVKVLLTPYVQRSHWPFPRCWVPQEPFPQSLELLGQLKPQITLHSNLHKADAEGGIQCFCLFFSFWKLPVSCSTAQGCWQPPVGCYCPSCSRELSLTLITGCSEMHKSSKNSFGERFDERDKAACRGRQKARSCLLSCLSLPGLTTDKVDKQVSQVS